MEITDAVRLVHRALERWGVAEGAEVHFIKYRENHVFRVDTSDGDALAVRLHRPGYRRQEEILTEVAYLEALAHAGVAVPTMVRALDGALLHTVRVDDASRLVSVQRWIHDASAFGDIESALSGRHSPSDESFRAIGRAIGQLHRAGAQIERSPLFVRDAWDADGLAGIGALWGDPLGLAALSPTARRSIAEALPGLHRRLTALGTDSSVYGVVHADATPENILETPQGIVLIDFDDFGTGWYVFDLVTAVFHHARHPRYAGYEQALRDGYAEWRELSPAELGAWDDLMLARGLTYLGWAAARAGDPAADFIATELAPWVADMAAASAGMAAAPWRAPAGRGALGAPDVSEGPR